VEPGNQASGDEGRDRERDKKDSTRADFLGGAGGNDLSVLALLLDKSVDRTLKLDGLGLRCRKCDLSLMLPPQFSRTHGDDPVLARHGGELVVETDQVFPLSGIGERLEVAFDLAPRRVDELAQRLQA